MKLMDKNQVITVNITLGALIKTAIERKEAFCVFIKRVMCSISVHFGEVLHAELRMRSRDWKRRNYGGRDMNQEAINLKEGEGKI